MKKLVKSFILFQGSADGQSFGWHVHQYGDVRAACAPGNTGGHFNPFSVDGGTYLDNKRTREVGQIGQVTCDADCKFFRLIFLLDHADYLIFSIYMRQKLHPSVIFSCFL